MKHALFILVLYTFSGLGLAHNGKPPVIEGDLPLTRVTQNIYVVHGPQVFPNHETKGFMNNPGFIITSVGVVVIDPGSSVQIGEKLLESIHRITDKPVVAVFNTHVHGDHWLGNQAMQEAYPGVNIYAHEKMTERIDDGAGEEWVALFEKMTEGATKGTRVVGPTISVEGNETIKIGDTDFHLYHPEKAHSDTDLVIELHREKSLFAGDILTNMRVQSARPQDGDILGQIKALNYFLESNHEFFIPGHGLTGGKDIVATQLTYLTDLYNSVKKYYMQDLDSFELSPLVKEEMKTYKDWYNFNELGRVIEAVYFRIEQEEFNN